MKKSDFILSPQRDVEIHGGRFAATSSEPWLVVGPCAALTPGKLVEIVYRANLWDEPTRPVFRFWLSSGGWRDQIAAGPTVGAAIWTGRIPAGTISVSVSPTTRLGRFDFALESIRRISSSALVARGLRLRPRAALASILERSASRGRDSGMRLDWAKGGAAIEHYSAWRKARSRPIDLEAIDAPRCDWTTGPEINLIVDANGGSSGDLACLITALRAQLYPRWRVCLVSDRNLSDLSDDPRISRLPRGELSRFLHSLPPSSIVAALAPGDALYPFALATVIEAAARSPHVDIFYGDEDYRWNERALVPVLKPGWSPFLQTNLPYLGRAVFSRAQIFADWLEAEIAAYVARAEIPAQVASRLDKAKPHALRRVLLTRGGAWPDHRDPDAALAAATAFAGNPSALLVIPMRDEARLLSHSLASIFAKTAFNNFSIIIVDSDSAEPDAQRLFTKFRGDRIVSVLHSPGPYNDSSLCNAGAARRKADVLVFLDNGVEILNEDWLGRLVAQALLPEVGAVGGQHFSPDGRLRRAGLALGASVRAPWLSAPRSKGGGDFLGRDAVTHEISAVPRACLAVARRKFMLVGGFDSDHLPNAHNDIDLCLRLAERGWAARIDPAVRLVQAEPSQTHSAPIESARAIAEQRRWFEARWLSVLRDDPYYHPALSLHGSEATLG